MPTSAAGARAEDGSRSVLFHVAQISNLLYRQFAIGSATTFRTRPTISKPRRLEALRYSRFGNLRYIVRRLLSSFYRHPFSERHPPRGRTLWPSFYRATL